MTDFERIFSIPSKHVGIDFTGGRGFHDRMVHSWRELHASSKQKNAEGVEKNREVSGRYRVVKVSYSLIKDKFFIKPILHKSFLLQCLFRASL